MNDKEILFVLNFCIMIDAIDGFTFVFYRVPPLLLCYGARCERN